MLEPIPEHLLDMQLPAEVMELAILDKLYAIKNHLA